MLPAPTVRVMDTALYIGTLSKAAQIVGGVDPLATALGVPMEVLEDWLTLRQALPTEVFLKAVDIVCEDEAKARATHRAAGTLWG